MSNLRRKIASAMLGAEKEVFTKLPVERMLLLEDELYYTPEDW
jgi:hypothetical protein